jgi:hypothetical protein
MEKIPHAYRMYTPGGELTELGREIVQRQRDGQRPVSHRMLKRAHEAALREDADIDIAQLEYLDHQLLMYAIG